MKSSRWVTCLGATGLAATLWGAALAPAADRGERTFVQGLRDRQYYDYAAFYLEQAAADPKVSEDFKKVIPYERAVTLLESAQATRAVPKKLEQLDQALGFLEQFGKDAPNHPLAGEANSRRAQILMGKSRAEVQQTFVAANSNNKEEFRTRARGYIAEARKILQTARDQHEAAFKQFPAHVDKAREPEKFAARTDAENSLLSAEMDLAKASYEEAQTYDAAAPERKTLLTAAAEAFESIHRKYTKTMGAWVARAWQGKAYEEQDDFPKALGIYKEILSQPDETDGFMALKDQVTHFQLISMNRKQPPDYAGVAAQGEKWLKDRARQSRSRTGLGIRLELAKAYEALGDDRNLIQPDKLRNWRLAKTNLEVVSRFPGEYREESTGLLQRVNGKLGDKGKAPEKFEQGLVIAQQSLQTISQTQAELTAAQAAKRPADETTKLQQDITIGLNEAARQFEEALALVTRDDDKKQVATARYLYAYVNYQLRRNYEAAILSDYVARTVNPEENSALALDAANLAMAAYIQAYNDSKDTSATRDTDMQLIIRAAKRIEGRFPDSDKANDARMQLGRLYSQLKKPVDAATWFNQIPETAPNYAEAQIAGGQAYWESYLAAANMSLAEKPTPEQLAEWKKSAQEKLVGGIAKISSTVPKEGKSPPNLIAAKWTLAQILVNAGQDAEALKVLTEEPHAPAKAVLVPEGEEAKRPDRGITSRTFASETYKLLVRSYIGAGKTNEAREAMKTLEKIAAGSGGSDVTQLYVSISKLLKDELERFKGTGETDRYNQLMGSFEAFMNDLSSRTEGQTFSSLNWIGETYIALGESSSGDAGRAEGFFEKAAASLKQAITLAQTDANVATPGRLLGVQLRLVRALQMKKDYEAAEEIIAELIAKKDNDVVLQTAAAELYLDWGTNGDSKYLQTAIAGDPSKKVWGFALLSTKLQRAVLASNRTDLTQQYLDARYHSTLTRQRLALSQSDDKKKQEDLAKAESELVSTMAILGNISDEQRTRFNDLYRQVLADQGKDVVDLPRMAEVPGAVVAAADPVEPDATAPAAEKTKTAKKAGPKKKVAKPSSLPMILGGLVVLGVVGGAGAYVYMNAQKLKAKKRKRSGSSSATVPAAAGAEAPKPRAKSPKPAGAAGGAAPSTPKPRPKPPTA